MAFCSETALTKRKKRKYIEWEQNKAYLFRGSLVFAPEMFGIARNDKAAIEAYVMKSAVESAEQLADKHNS